jgi:hypothetical protein
MSVHNYLYITAICFGVMGCDVRVYADSDEGDVTILRDTAPPPTASSQKTAQSSDASAVHKSLHKQKSTGAAISSGAVVYTTVSSVASANTKAASEKPVVTEVERAKASSDIIPNLGPTVETGLPIARHITSETLMPGEASSISPGWQNGTSSDPNLASRALAPTASDVSSTTVGSYSLPDRITTPTGDFVFANFARKEKNTYPWKTGIFTTKFWIGEGGSAISSTDNVASAWDENWRSSNSGSDNPYNRSGYAPADHAPTVNPFYVALPFNDLADPEKARRWLPPGWYRPPKDGKQVSACKDRWVEIKNSDGRICFAQWEDVGPLESDHAEYVFGPERPEVLTRAGLDVSPAVAQYLGLGESGYTSWRFVDDEDVLPGKWLTYDELALLYAAMHAEKDSPANLPIQRQSEPSDEPSNMDANKKKVGAAKG